MRIIFLFMIVCWSFFSSLALASENKQILLINSYHRGFQWSDDVISGIEEVLYNHRDIDVNILYMDFKRITSDEYSTKLRDLYKLQLKNHKYDLILAVDKFAYEFALHNYHELFTDEPLFFTGIEQFNKDLVVEHGLEKKVSGILEKRAISDTVKMIDKLMPKLKTLYIINDKSANGDDSEPFIQQAINEIGSKYKVEYIRKATLQELQDKFSVFKPHEAAFFIRFYNNQEGHLYKNSEIAAMIDASAIPMFITDTLFIGKGALGGKLVPIKELGKKTGERVVSLLQGTLKTPHVEVAETFEYVFDYVKVKQFGLQMQRLGDSFDYINTPLSFFDKYRQFINFVFILSPLFILLIAGLIHNLYLRIQSAKKLQQRMEFDKVLLDAIESPIVWQDQSGKIVDSNSKFCALMDFPCPKTRGKVLKDYIRNTNATSLIKALRSFMTQTNENNEIVLKDKEEIEKIYLVKQAQYAEDVYKSKGTVTIFTDVTSERKALRAKMKHQEFIIQQSKLAEIGEIFSSIAHQWKSPLVEITTIAQEQLYANGSAVDEQNSQYVNDIMVQVRYMTDTINDFQQFIMPSAQKVVFNIQDAITRMMSIVRHNMKYNYIDVTINVDKDANLMILGYKNELMQTLLNIVNNAKDAIIKAKEKKKIDRGRIDIRISNVEHKIKIEIEDNGGGIDMQSMEKVFEPYFSTKEEGHGIGLYMTKLIIEDKMGGKIYVLNAREGAQFCIELEQYYENIST